jgi:3-oxoadipate enol-lactonase
MSAAGISQPALSVVGTETHPVWVEIAGMLRCSLPNVEECRIEGAGHLLQIQRSEPVARGMAQFLERHPMSVGGGTRARAPAGGAPGLQS